MCLKTRCCIILPFNLVLELCNLKGIKKNGDKYDGTKLNSSVITRILREPEKVIEELVSDAADYKIERLRIPRTLHFRNLGEIKCKRVRQFPILKISYDKYSEWAKDFAENGFISKAPVTEDSTLPF